ncbi:peptidoglycan-binding domain-containing protein [Kribbella sp. NPDC003557]|uniref:peptidoglycan-binding domain-containing protein n=1 Tax=Kribbella sp. NPDC003557 TaxID=3154449 RepID=UPI0033A968A0
MTRRTALTVVRGRGEQSVEVVEARRYLARYGYMSDDSQAASDADRLTDPTSVALRRFQRFARLHVTGTPQGLAGLLELAQLLASELPRRWASRRAGRRASRR